MSLVSWDSGLGLASGFRVRWAILRHPRGLAASPPVRYILIMERAAAFLSRSGPLMTDEHTRVTTFRRPGDLPVRPVQQRDPRRQGRVSRST
ncbi:hypothetical protein GZL_07988 [Streptomyces sp. 769]|nr:hypothetical protein GZL_07988 [Streptomyces sp. 769]